MNVLFIYSSCDINSPAKPLYTPEFIQFGISYISSLLKKHGHQTSLLVLSRVSGPKNQRMIDEQIRTFKPKLICFTAVSTEYPFISEIARDIKERHKDIYLLLGGAHASLNPQEAIASDFDAVCIGEGEWPTLELAAQLAKDISPSGIANLWIKRGTNIEKNPTRPFLQDLDSLPFPDRTMWSKWIDERGERHSVLLGRGCPFQCTYCSNHALRKLASGPYVRFRKPDNILAEIRELAAKQPAKRELYLEVETIGPNKQWALELCAKLRHFNAQLDRPFTFGVNIRVTPGADYEELFAAFKKSNFRFINIGLESGSERVRREILRRNYSNQDIIKAVSLARKHGLEIGFTNMIGFPTETPADFEETIKLNRTCAPDWSTLYIFYPYPGTDLHALCHEWGLLPEELDTAMERNRAVLDLPHFPKRQIQKYYVWFNYHIHKGRLPLPRTILILFRTFMLKLKSAPYLSRLSMIIKNNPLYKRLRRMLKK